jgi:hypothetical protein
VDVSTDDLEALLAMKAESTASKDYLEPNRKQFRSGAGK